MSPQVNGTYFKIMRYLLPTKIAAVLLATTSLAELVHDFAENGDLASVQAELGKGVDLGAQDCDGKTPLHSAAYEVHKETDELLTANGADVNAKEDLMDETPLDWSNDEIADILHKNGSKTGEELKA